MYIHFRVTECMVNNSSSSNSSSPGSAGYIIKFDVHRAYDYSSPFGVRWEHMAQ